MKRIILIFCSIFLLFNLYSCASDTPTPEQQQILNNTNNLNQMTTEIKDKTAKMNEDMNKYDQTLDKKYLDEAQQYSDEIDALRAKVE